MVDGGQPTALGKWTGCPNCTGGKSGTMRRGCQFPARQIRERADSVVRRVPRLDQLAAQSREPLASEADQPARHLDFEEIVERLVMENLNRGTGREPELAPVPKSGRIVVLSLTDAQRLPGAEVGEALE